MGLGLNLVGTFGANGRGKGGAKAPLLAKEAPRVTQTPPTPPPTAQTEEARTWPNHSAPTWTKASEPSVELKIPFQKLAVTTATSQISSLVFCLAWSVRFNFYESTATHCRVDNYLPSLSATLDFTPQRDVWRACIGLSGLPRYFIAYLYYQLIYKSKVLLWFHWIEITALIGLSIVDSIKYFAFHATCVGIFLLTSIIHMTLVCNHYVRPDLANLSESTRQKLKRTEVVKKRIAIINLLAIVVALYLYDRHNRYCEPGVYSMFSFLEYIVIVANIVYHLQAYYDLDDYSILVTRVGSDSFKPAASLTTKSTMIDKKRS